MLLKSSSTPVLGSLSEYSDLDREFINTSLGPRRRSQSEGNLEDLIAIAAAASSEFPSYKPLLKSFGRSRSTMLRSVPSFSVFCSENEYEEVEEGNEVSNNEFTRSISIGDHIRGVRIVDDELKRSNSIGDHIRRVKILDKKGTFSFGENLDFIQEEEGEISKELLSFSGNDEEGRPKSPPLYMARGLGVDVGFGGAGADFSQPEYGEGDWDTAGMGEYFKKMVEENPDNTLFLRNYAQFLYQAKGDLPGAEEYYARAILLEPRDGEMLSQYAKIIWELYRDHKKASTYYERSVQFAPQNCHVHAAYASFLWETDFEDDEEEDGFPQDLGEPAMFWNRRTEDMKVAV